MGYADHCAEEEAGPAMSGTSSLPIAAEGSRAEPILILGATRRGNEVAAVKIRSLRPSSG